MAYGSTAGALPGLKKAPLATKPKAPCKYGPRTSAGTCPKKPAAAKPPCKYGPRNSKGLCPKKPKNLAAAVKSDIKAGRTVGDPGSASAALVQAAVQKGVDRAATKLGTTVAGSVSKAADKYAKARAAGTVGTAVGAASAAQLTGVALAGLASYWITKKLLEARQARRTSRAEQAAAAADAYRLARTDAVKQQKGKALSTQQHLALANAFKAELKKLGLSTTNLKGL